MIIHSFLTDGFMGGAEVFLKSFKIHHEEEIKIILDTRDLSEKQINKLHSLYSNLEIHNKILSMHNLVSETGIDKGTLLGFKNAVENNSVTTKNKIGKQFISVEQRYRDSIGRCFQQYKDTEDFMLHLDIDIYFRNHLQELFEFIKQHDICIRFRPKAIDKGRENRCVLGNLISFKFCDNVEQFLQTGHSIINSVPLKNKPKGYGQTSFGKAYLKHKDMNWGNLPSNIKVKNTAKNALMGSANRGSKEKNLKLCREDMKGK